MDLLSVCPLRIAGTITKAGKLRELSVIVRATLERGASGQLDLSSVQSLPDAEELRLLESSDPAGDRTVPPPSNMAGRIRGRVVAGGTLFAFGGAPPELGTHRVPSLRPKLFLEERGAATELKLDIATITLDPVSAVVSVVWRARSGLTSDDETARAVVALERDDERVTWTELITRTRGLVPSFLRQRTRTDAAAPGAAAAAPLDEDTYTMATADGDQRPGDNTLPFVGRRESAPRSSPGVEPPVPQPAMQPAPLPPISAPPPRQTIGEALIARPAFARDKPALREQQDEVAPKRATRDAALESNGSKDVGLDLVWHAEGASARLRKEPDLKRLVLAARSGSDDRRDGQDLAGVAQRASRTALDALPQAIARAARDGVLDAPAVVVDGVIELIFEPVEVLRALVSAAKPGAASNERLARAIETAEAVTKGELAESAWILAEPETVKLREAITAAMRAEAAKSIDDAVERKLAKEKKLVGVTVLGAPHFVARILPATGAGRGNATLVYLPVEAGNRWPLLARFSATVIGEVRPALEEREGGAALIGIVLYRRVSMRALS